MSTSKHFNKICIAVIAVALILTFAAIFVKGSDTSTSHNQIGYENRIFSTDKVHTIDIVMNNWDSFIENCESEEYSICTLVIDGEKFSNIGIRAKGNTSLSNVKSMGSQRYSFKLEFDQYENGKNYYGLDKLCLNNLIQDNTMMKDYLVYQMMYEFGVDTPLSSFVFITVNGQDWGLYLAVESIEDSFLQRNYGSESGELYKPDSLSFGGGRGNGRDFDMNKFTSENSENDSENNSDSNNPDNGGMPSGDFNPFGGDMPDMSSFGGDFDFSNMPDGFNPFDNKGSEIPSPDGQRATTDNTDGKESTDKDKSSRGGKMDFGGMFGGMGSDDVKLKYIDDDPDSYSNIFNNAKTIVNNADKERLIASLKNLTEYTDLENTVDMDEVLRYFVIHNFVVNGDSYTGSMIHNYYLYEDEGQLSMIPWDYNLAYGTFMAGNASSTVNDSIDSPVSGDINDRPMVGWIFSDEEYTEMYHELFREFQSEWLDSGKLEQMVEDTANLIRPYVEKDTTRFCTMDEFEAGVSAMSQFISLRAEAIRRQLNGDDTPVDCGDLNTSVFGQVFLRKNNNHLQILFILRSARNTLLDGS